MHATFTLSSTSLLSQSKATLALSLNILGANRPDPTLFVAAMRVVQLILVRSTWHVEWAREVIGAAVIQRTVQSFVSAANGEITEVCFITLGLLRGTVLIFSRSIATNSSYQRYSDTSSPLPDSPSTSLSSSPHSGSRLSM